MLSELQKNELHGLIVLFIGNDVSVSRSRPHFNSATVEVVERMIEANIDCNQTMKDLVSELISGGRVRSRGWLKHALGGARAMIERAELRGYGCQVSAKAKWKTAIIASTY